MFAFTDPYEKLYYFKQVLQEPSLSEQERQDRLIDLDYTAIPSVSRRRDQRWKRYISFSTNLHEQVREAQLAHAAVKVANARRFFASLEVFQVVEAIFSGLDSVSLPVFASEATSVYPRRTTVIIRLGEEAARLSDHSHRQVWSPAGKDVTRKMEGEIGILLYEFCEKVGLVKTVEDTILGIDPVKKGFAGKQFFSIISPLNAPSRVMANLLPRILPPKEWRRVGRGKYATSDGSSPLTPANEGTGEVEGIQPMRRISTEQLIATKSKKHFSIDLSEEHLAIINLYNKVPMRVCDRLYRYIEANKERMIAADFLGCKSIVERDIVKEVELLKKNEIERWGLRHIEDLPPSEIKALKRKVKAHQVAYTAAMGRYQSDELVLSMARILRGRPLYFEAFHDFRGRTYGWSALDPQRSQLARNLTTFSKPSPIDSSNQDLFLSHLGFAFRKFATFTESLQWMTKNIEGVLAFQKDLSCVIDGKRVEGRELEDPWRALSISLLLNKNRRFNKVVKAKGKGLQVGGVHFRRFETSLPFHLDATASAFQILGLIARDPEICQDCNIVLPFPSLHLRCTALLHTAGQRAPKPIKDRYQSQPDGKRDLYKQVADSMAELNVAQKHLFTRDVVKQVLMPKSYGLTNYGIYQTIREAFPGLSKEERSNLARRYIALWGKRFKSIETIFKAFSELGKMVAFHNLPLICSIHPRVEMLQQYCAYKTVKGRVAVPTFSETGQQSSSTRLKKKSTWRRTINLRIYNDKKGDVVKSGNSTAANITHMIDGLISVELLRLFYRAHPGTLVPLYTNHDCFYTTFQHIGEICPAYQQAVVNILGLDTRFAPCIKDLSNQQSRHLQATSTGNTVRSIKDRSDEGCKQLASLMQEIPHPSPGRRDQLMWKIFAPNLTRVLAHTGFEKDEIEEILTAVADSNREGMLSRGLDKRIEAAAIALIEYQEMVAPRPDLLPRVLESKYPVFP